MSDITTINISLFDKNYQLKCKINEIDRLKQAGTYLDMKIREISQAGNAVGFERTTMMAALDVCYELMCMREEKANYDAEVSTRLKMLNDRVSSLINDNNI